MTTKNYFLHLTFIFILLSFVFETQATIRYVSHEGSSTPPYTTWETAADSIQECINYSVNGDTIIVANGVYYESLIVNKYLWLIGSSMDSTVIDGTGLADITVDFQSDGHISYFTIKGKGEGTIQTVCILTNLTNAEINNCRIMNARDGIGVIWSSSIVDKCLISNVLNAYSSGCDPDTCNAVIKKSVIVLQNGQPASYAILIDGGNAIVSNNIIIDGFNSITYTGIESGLFLNNSKIVADNNVVSGFAVNIEGFAEDTAIVHNNSSSHAVLRGITINSKSDMRNNVLTNNGTGVVGPTTTNSDYNLYWQNNTNTTGGLAEHDIVADPMFVNDTIPVYGGSYDYHLQMFSPAIDAGDPNILDVDGTRSDIGAYGGPGGEKYTYIDLPPRQPVNLSAEIDTVSNIVILAWNRNSEADTAYYNVYRDSTINFPVDSSKLISSQADTVFLDVIPPGYRRVVYKITAVDQQENESQPSEEQVISIVGIEKDPVVINNYILYQNYPNPFNPSTKIGYKLKERGYVKLMVYDIKGELVTILVNEVQESGYHEVEFNASAVSSHSGLSGISALASGIYLYRIEVIGEGQIPRFSDMKKMILIK